MSGWRKKQIADLQAGAEVMAGDGGYEIGNAEDQAAFAAKREKQRTDNPCLTCDCMWPCARSRNDKPWD